MTPVENDVLRKLERANPVAGGEVSGSVKGGEARELLARVTASEAKTGAGRRRSWVRAGVPAMTATVVIALVAVSLIGGRRTEISPERGSGIEAPEGTPEPLQRIAAVAATQPEVLLPEGGFRYTKSENRYLSVSILSENRFYSVMQPAIREIWVAPDGGGRLRTEYSGHPEFLTAQDEQSWKDAGSPGLQREPVNDTRFPGGDPGGSGLHFERFDGLPTDPEAMYKEIEKRSRNQGITLHQQMFDTVGSLLRETNSPPDIRAAVFLAAARIPGVDVTENVADPEGRPGIALSIVYNPGGRRIRNELIFDPQTSALLAEGQYALEKTPLAAPTDGRPGKPQPTAAPVRDMYGELAPGTQVGGAVYLDWGIVNSVEERP